MRHALLWVSLVYSLGASFAFAFWMFRDEYRKWKHGQTPLRSWRDVWGVLRDCYGFSLGWPYFAYRALVGPSTYGGGE